MKQRKWVLAGILVAIVIGVSLVLLREGSQSAPSTEKASASASTPSVSTSGTTTAAAADTGPLAAPAPPTARATEAPEDVASAPTPGPSPAVAPSSDSSTLPPIAAEVPELETLRQEVRENPHTTPDSILKFSLAIGEKIDREGQTDEGAAKIFGELEGCVHSESEKGSFSVSALCLLNAQKLMKKHPALSTRFDQLVAKVDPETLRRARPLF